MTDPSLTPLEQLILRQLKKAKMLSLDELINFFKEKAIQLKKQPLSEDKIIKAITNLQHIHRLIEYDPDSELFFLPFIPTKNINKKNIERIFLKCPHCNAKPEYYNFKSSTKRKHTKCKNKNCNKNIEVSIKTKWDPTKIYQKTKNQQPLQSSSNLIQLKDLDEMILTILRDPKLSNCQKDIAKICKKHPSTISRHLKKLEQMGLIKRISISPSFYSIIKPIKALQDLVKQTKATMNFVATHKARSKCYIIKGKDRFNPDVLNIFYNVNYNFRNSRQSHFLLKDGLKVTLTEGKRSSLIFSITGYGRDSDEAMDNIHDKSKEVCQFLEQKYNLSISNPQISWNKKDANPHMVPCEICEDEISTYQTLREAWTDKSHFEAVETTSKNFIKKIMKVSDAIPSIIDEIDDLKLQVSQLQQGQQNQIITEILRVKNLMMIEIDKKLKQNFKQHFKQQNIELSTSIGKAVGIALGEALEKYLP